jgi:HEAT repeat protein
MKAIIYISIISILLISGCIEQKSVDIPKNSPFVTQTPNASTLETIKDLEKIRDNKSIELLISMFNDKSEQVQQYSMAALVNIGEPAVEQLIQASKNQDPNVRICAANVLGKIGDERSIEPIKQLLNDTDETVRIEAQKAYNELNTTLLTKK